MGTISIITSIAFTGMFVMAIILFAVNFGINNETTINIDEDSNFSQLKNEISEESTTLYLDSNTIFNETIKSTISSQTEATEGGTAFKVGPGTAMKVAQSSIKVGFEKIFGGDENVKIFFTSFLTLLGIIFSMYIYKSWKGSPD
jgi:hypothetical protein